MTNYPQIVYCPRLERRIKMDKEPTQEQIKELWERCLNARVELREGFYGECGEFIEMQNNPYGPPHRAKALCYLEEDRELSERERAEYEKDLSAGKFKVRFIPQRAQLWEEVPPIDLDNLFELAVPIVLSRTGWGSGLTLWLAGRLNCLIRKTLP